MENLIWLPALAALALMSSTAILNAELWKNKAKKGYVKNKASKVSQNEPISSKR